MYSENSWTWDTQKWSIQQTIRPVFQWTQFWWTERATRILQRVRVLLYTLALETEFSVNSDNGEIALLFVIFTLCNLVHFLYEDVNRQLMSFQSASVLIKAETGCCTRMPQNSVVEIWWKSILLSSKMWPVQTGGADLPCLGIFQGCMIKSKVPASR